MLSVTCPRCESKYQLDGGMRGKRMRCPNPICRAVFEVRDDSDPPSPPEVKLAEEPKAKEAPLPVESKKPEPVQRRPIPKPIDPQPAADFPDDFPGDEEAVPETSSPAIATEAWQPEVLAAPAVRDEPTPILATYSAPISAPVKRRRAIWVIGAMLLALGIVAGVAFWRIQGSIASNEAERFQQAEELYKQHDFAEASASFQKLHRDFPESADNKKYRFLAELSDVRQAAYTRESPDETVKAFGRVQQLAVVYRGDPLLKEREADLGQTLDFLANELVKLAEREKAPALLPLAKRVWGEAKKYPPPPGASLAERERKLNSEWTRVDSLLTTYLEKQHVITTLKEFLDRTSAANIQEAWALVEKTKRQDDPEIRSLLDELYKSHREQIKFVPTSAAEKRRTIEEDDLPSLSVTTVVGEVRAAKSSQPLILSLARGVLYALDPAKGEPRWTRRVGIDSHLLPLHIPADAITPELLLVLSSDQPSLSALVAETGEVLWQTPLSDACLGSPVLVDRQVLVPTIAGRIDEIETAEGRRLGSYHVGQPLTLGGVRQPGTPFVYFPADEFCLYVFDITKRTCTNILYTRHAAGSLRGLPIIVPGEKGGWLLWCQTLGLDRVVIKPFELPIQSAEQKPVDPILQLPGTSAPPWQHADRLALATETGYLSLWGFRQKGTRDPLLFPLLKEDVPIDPSKNRGRCQVVYADAENYWTMTRGKLQRLEANFHPQKGPTLAARWTQPIALGNSLHAAQARQDPDGRTILYLTTQADEHPTCLCSAVDADDGKILWQRQVGVLPSQTPLDLGGALFVRDAQGLFRFDPGVLTSKRWQAAGDRLFQEPWTEASRILLTRENSYVQLTLPRAGTKLHVQVGVAAHGEKARTFDVALPATLQGTPVLGDGFVLLPLANGIIVRVNLKDGAIINGPDWRIAGAEEQTAGHLLLLDANDFVLTDGSRGLSRIASPDGKTWDKRADSSLAHRIIRPPILVQAAEKGKARLCVADAFDTLTLLDAERLTVLRRWTLPSKLTTGPFLRAGKIGCVVGRNRLVWLDPNQEAPAWEYGFDADLVGEPHVIDGILVVADVAGQFLALDPSSGRPLGSKLTLKANVAATATPLPFGPGQAFVPLTDGTIVLLPLERLRK